MCSHAVIIRIKGGWSGGWGMREGGGGGYVGYSILYPGFLFLEFVLQPTGSCETKPDGESLVQCDGGLTQGGKVPSRRRLSIEVSTREWG